MNRTDLTFFLMGKKYGFDLKKMVDFTMQSQYWSADEIHKYQLEKLQKMIHHAYAKVPYYTKLMREMGMEPGDFKAIDDLAAFPILRKETIQANPESFLASDWKRY
nr:phenylacetate--CoA ligase [Smithella sp.]